jgi:hypothetical protein
MRADANTKPEPRERQNPRQDPTMSSGTVARNFRAEKWAGKNKSPREAAVGRGMEQLARLARLARREKKGRGLSGSMDERFGSCEICAHTEQDSKRPKSFTGRGLVPD